MKKLYLWLVILIFSGVSAFGLSIESPLAKVYETTEDSMLIDLTVGSNETFGNLGYGLDNNSAVVSCNNCSGINESLNLSVGNHTLIVVGLTGNDSVSESVEFSIEKIVDNSTQNETHNTTADFNLEIVTPEDKTYNTTEIGVYVVSNETLDLIEYKVGGNYSLLCEICSSVSSVLNLSEGSYTLDVKGVLGEVEKEVSVEFTIDLNNTEPPENETPEPSPSETPEENEDEPNYSTGYNKLPKRVMNGEISDQELAEIISGNKLNPGVINRLIKTGKLGEASIDAILGTQQSPPGIFKKLFGLIGFKQKSYSELIFETYNLSEKIEQQLLVRDDIPSKYVEKISDQFEKKMDKLLENKTDDKPSALAYKAGKQNGKNPIKEGKENPGKAIGKNSKDNDPEDESSKSKGNSGKGKKAGGGSGGRSSGGKGKK